MPSKETMLASKMLAMKGRLSSAVDVSDENLFKILPAFFMNVWSLASPSRSISALKARTTIASDVSLLRVHIFTVAIRRC